MSGPLPSPSSVGSKPDSRHTPEKDLESGNLNSEDGRSIVQANVHVQYTQSSSSLSSSSEGAGIAFFIRRRGGLTAALTRHADSRAEGVAVLVESSYGKAAMSIFRAPSTAPTFSFPNVVLIAGGVGITGVLPLLDRPLLAPSGKTMLFWSVRTDPLVCAVENMVGNQATRAETGESRRWGEAEVKISVGKRFNIKQVVKVELLGVETKGGTTVVRVARLVCPTRPGSPFAS